MQYKFVLYLRLLQKIFPSALNTYSRTRPAKSFRSLFINLALLIKSGFDLLIMQMRNQRCISEGTSSLINIKFKSQASFCGCTASFVPDLVLNPDDIFSHDMAHMKQY